MNNSLKENFAKVEGMLYDYKLITAEVQNIALEIEAVENDYCGMGSLSYEEKTGKTNKISSIVENEVISKEKRVEKLMHMKRNKEIQILKIDNSLNTLTENERELIKLRYFNKLQFKDICQRLCINETYIYELKKKTIEKLVGLIFI